MFLPCLFKWCCHSIHKRQSKCDSLIPVLGLTFIGMHTDWLFFSSFTLRFIIGNPYTWMKFSLKTNKTPSLFPQLKCWQMIKHDSDACMTYCLPFVMTNITSMQRSMKDDRLGYLNLHSLSQLHCSLAPQDAFSECTWCCKPSHPCWPTWLMVQFCHFNKRALACKRSPGVLKCHLSDFIDVMFAWVNHAIVKHISEIMWTCLCAQ